jgi:hypothetical protein
MRNLFENARITTFPTASGTIIGASAGGTVNGAPLNYGEYHSVIYAGTFANNGTLNVYACTNSAGSNPAIIRSLPIGSNTSAAIAVDVKTSALGSLSTALGTTYTHLGAFGTVESGGTWRGALFIISTNLRVNPAGTTGLASYGTYLT